MKAKTTLALVLYTCLSWAQTNDSTQTTLKADKRPVKVSLLSNYYDQDGDRSAINGGLGSQKLNSYAQEAHIYVPVKDSSGLSVNGGVDYYTSASLKEIDKYKSEASAASSGVSGKELRKFGSISYDYALKGKGTTLSPSVGFSKEYDVTSVNGGLGFSRRIKRNGALWNSAFSVIIDRWMMVFPGEFRAKTELDASSGASAAVVTGYASPFVYKGDVLQKDGQTYPIDWRQSFALVNTYAFTINQRMNGAVGLDLLAQTGLLSAPFHRVYFNDGVGDEYQKEVRVESLPRERYKVALSGRFNYFINPLLVLRTQGRFYADTWDIFAFTFNVEVASKITRSLSLSPFYRLHLQDGTSYYRAYGQHVYTPGSHYTSDIDLATFSAHKVGGALRFTPFKSQSVEDGEYKKSFLSIKDIGLRYARYWRLDGLDANVASLEINFEF